jgi:multiple sugar transport system permease protein
MNGGGLWRRLSGYLFVAPYLVLFAAFILLPVLFGLGLSLFRWEMLSPLAPEFIGVDNYREAMGDEYFWMAVRATALFVVMAVPLTIVMAMTISLGLAALNKRRALYRAAYFLPVMINISVAGILWRWFYNSEFGLFNAYLAKAAAGFGTTAAKVPWLSDPRVAMPSVVLMTLWWHVGGPAVILLAGIKQIPDSYYEAASLDGASAWQRFTQITLLKPVLLFVIVMNLIGSFQVFGQTFIMTRGGPELSTRVLVQYIYESAFNFYRMGYSAAMSWLLFVAIAAVAAAHFFLLRER